MELTDTRLWRVIGFHVEAAHRAKDWSGVCSDN